MYFLVQLKVEPGNINYIQLSPTIQATRSNFLAAHGGKSVPFLEYFRYGNKGEKSKILVDQLQSEQGSRFLGNGIEISSPMWKTFSTKTYQIISYG